VELAVVSRADAVLAGLGGSASPSLGAELGLTGRN